MAIESATQNDTARVPREIYGYAIFSDGDLGAAHVAAHDAFDRGAFEPGFRQLRSWLDGRTGTDSGSVHLHFHLALFELELGRWHDAYTRFRQRLLPTAAETTNALTDAPGLLWRLALSAPSPIALPWQPLQRRALTQLGRHCTPFVELHHLLTLAGAHDLQGLQHWLSRTPSGAPQGPDRLVQRAGVALCAYVKGDYREAAARLGQIAPALRQLGGSAAQHRLFEHLVGHCAAKADHAAACDHCRLAA